MKKILNSKLNLLIFILFISFLIFCHTEAAGNTYYISSTDGDDSCSGLSQTIYAQGVTDCPFKTLTKVNSTTFVPGDSILFKSGDTFYGSITISQSGTAGNPITFYSYGSGNQHGNC